MTANDVLHIDRNQLFREGLRRILDGSEFNIGFGVSSFSEGKNRVVSGNPNLIIIDPAGFGDVISDLIATVRAVARPAHVVVLTDSVAISRLTGALSAGVDGYLLKDMSTDALRQSLSLVLMGEKVFPTDLAHLLISRRFVEKSTSHPTRSQLSDREGDILMCLVNGLSNKAIANRLEITEGTVKVHLKAVLKKIGVSNRTQAAIWAIQHGIVADAFSNRDARERRDVRAA